MRTFKKHIFVSCAALLCCVFASNAQESVSKSVDIRPKFSTFAQKYVVEKMNSWQVKGEFEKNVEWQARVTGEARQRKIESLTQEAENLFIESQTSYIPVRCTLGPYDADNEVFLVKDPQFGDLLVPVPRENAIFFKNNFYRATVIPRYFIQDDHLGLASKSFRLAGESYSYSNQASLNYDYAQVDYSGLEEIKITVPSSNPSGRQNIGTKIIIGGKSDIDVNIPTGKGTKDNCFALIIANENYSREKNVNYALNDGFAFKEYCNKTLGLPSNNIRYVPDATLGSIINSVDWITKLSETYNGEADLIFYYAGHGIPDDNNGAFILPTDGDAHNALSAYSLNNLYAELGSCNARSSYIVLDACFSGIDRDGEAIIESRGVVRVQDPANPNSLKGNTVVFSATGSDQMAFPYKEKQHGLFTYYILKKIQQTDGDACLGEVFNYVQDNVGKEALKQHSKSQTPTVAASVMASEWKKINIAGGKGQ